MRNVFLCLLIAMALALPRARAATPDPSDIKVGIERDGAVFTVDIDMPVEAPARTVWDVLTDYDHMSQFVSNVVESRVVSRDGLTLEVEQRSRLAFGLIRLEFENLREIELVPFTEIRSRLVRGDMKASSFTTRLEESDGVTHVRNHGRFTSDRWIPPIIGNAVLESETRKQFSEFRAEMLRRREH